VHHVTPPREPLPSLASVLEPNLWFPSRPVLVPPDPESFRPPGPPPSFLTRRASELRWVARIVLLSVIVVGELVLADSSGALHAPRDFADARTMIADAAHASVSNALTR
jgi:hypothetical protein